MRIALLGLRCPVPDLVVSGVNAGGNMGADVTYSGTVGAAFEAALRGHPALAFSVEELAPGWLDEAEPVLRAMVGHVVDRGLPRHSILNINLPDRPLAAITGIRPARLGGASALRLRDPERATTAPAPASTTCRASTPPPVSGSTPTSTWSPPAPWP